MGLCASGMTEEEAQQKKATEEMDKKLRKDYLKDNAIHKLLLLGAGESGKSTLFKQMITIYGKGFNEDERRGFIPIVHSNVMASVKALCEAAPHFREKHGEEYALHPEVEPIADYLRGLKTDNTQISRELAMRIDVVWKSPAIQKIYDHRNEFQLNDSTEYFLNDVMRVSEEKYIPTQQDVLRSRVRTTGIVEQPFVIDGNNFKMFDVGGQRNERKKWIHCFENVTAVLFVAALHEYDMRLFEDENQNRMVEAVVLFDEIANSPFFRKTAMILFLNKRDLFAEKIGKSDLRQCPLFEEYDGPQDYENGCDLIKNEFVSKIRQNADQQCYAHITCATDTNQCKVVFNAVKDIVIRRSLKEGGIL